MLLIEIFDHNKANFGQQMGNFINTSMLGAKVRTEPMLNEDLNIFYLQHILSPSAIHLAPFFMMIKYFLKNRHFILFKISVIPMFLTISSLIHPAVTRYLHIEILCSISQVLFPSKKISHISLLFSSLLIDYYFGSYFINNFSFYYSYVLLGNLYLLSPHIGPWASLIIGQLSLHLGNGIQINLLTSIMGFILGLIFGFINTVCLFFITCQFLLYKAFTSVIYETTIYKSLKYTTIELYELFFELLRVAGEIPTVMNYAGREDIFYFVLLLWFIRTNSRRSSLYD